MQPANYILFVPCASQNPPPAESTSRQIRQAAVHLAEAGRVLLASRRHILSRSTCLAIEAIAADCHRLVVELEEGLW